MGASVCSVSSYARGGRVRSSFATPIGYQTNLLLLSAGGYKFTDFMRAGIPLAILMWLGFSIVLPIIYDL